jgi:hypothetical protein
VFCGHIPGHTTYDLLAELLNACGREVPMDRKSLVSGSGLVLLLTGVAVLVGSVTRLMSLFGVAELPEPHSGDPTWVGIAFARVFGAALVALGLVGLGARRLSGQSARAVAIPLATGLAVLAVFTALQALAIWATPTAWVLGGIIAAACVSVGAWGFTEHAVA